MVVVLSDDLGPRCCENRDLPAPRSNIDQDKTAHISMKKHQHPRTEEDGGDDQDNTELSRKRKMKKSGPETETDPSPSDHSCFVALVKASNLQDDALYLPNDFTSSNGLKRKCREIVLTDEGERSWALDLRFNESSETFYITRGWRSFCDVNGKTAGSFFKFKLMRNGEIPLLSVCPTESVNDTTQGDKNNRQRCRESTSQHQNRFVTLTLTHEGLKKTLRLPLPFMRENGLDKPGMITLLGKDGTRRLANLLRDGTGRMSLGKGLKEFIRANRLKMGESFTLELIWENATPVLSLLSTELRNQNRSVTLTLTQASFKKNRLRLPLLFMRKNGLDKPGVITLLGKDGTKWPVNLLRDGTGRMSLGKGSKEFAIGNSVKIGESFTLKLIWKDSTPLLSFLSEESPSDRRQQEEHCPKDSETDSIPTEPSSGNKTWKAKNNREEKRDSSSAIHNRFLTLTLSHEDVKDCKLILPSQFLKANGINKLGKMILLGKDRMKYSAYLLSRDGFVALGIDWEGFCEANDVKTGESFTLEFLYEQETTPMFKFRSNSGD